MFKKAWKYYAVAIVVVVLDQILKLWVYWNMQMGAWGQIKVIGNWFKLHYTLNPGMAFGIQFGFSYDKILLTVIRIVATLFIIRYIWRLTRTAHTQKHSPLGFADASSTSADAASQKHLMHQSCFIYGWALVLGGAIGNGIDSIFYGKLLNNAPTGALTPWFSGQVIDMLYIDIWAGKLPHWIPFFGGNVVTCLPIFNLADVAILTGIGFVVLASKTSATLTSTVEEVQVSSNITTEERIITPL